MCIKSAELAIFWLLYKFHAFEKADFLSQKTICSSFYCKVIIPEYQHLMLLS